MPGNRLTWVSSAIVGLAAVRIIGRQVRPANGAFQHIEARDACAARDAPPAVHPADRRMLAGEILLQPYKLPLRFYIQNAIVEEAILRQQLKEIAHQHTEGAAGNDVGRIVVGGGTLLFLDFCIMLFQHGGQRRELCRFQLGEIGSVAKHQITAGNEPVIKFFLRDLTIML